MFVRKQLSNTPSTPPTKLNFPIRALGPVCRPGFAYLVRPDRAPKAARAAFYMLIQAGVYRANNKPHNILYNCIRTQVPKLSATKLETRIQTWVTSQQRWRLPYFVPGNEYAPASTTRLTYLLQFLNKRRRVLRYRLSTKSRIIWTNVFQYRPLVRGSLKNLDRAAYRPLVVIKRGPQARPDSVTVTVRVARNNFFVTIVRNQKILKTLTSGNSSVCRTTRQKRSTDAFAAICQKLSKALQDNRVRALSFFVYLPLYYSKLALTSHHLQSLFNAVRSIWPKSVHVGYVRLIVRRPHGFLVRGPKLRRK